MEKSTQLDRTRCPLDDAPLFVGARDCVMLQNFNRIERGYDTICSVINRLTDLSALRLENHVAPFGKQRSVLADGRSGDESRSVGLEK